MATCGPSSPIYGPSQIGGYLNFVPKSARAKNGQYVSETTGDVSIDVGSVRPLCRRRRTR